MYNWNGPLVKYFSIVSGCYVLSFCLIVSASVLLKWQKEEPKLMQMLRISLLGLNLLLLCISLCTFEIRSFLADKLGYFQSFWNLNDIGLFIMSTVTLFQELKSFISNRGGYDSEIDEDDGESMLRMLKKKRRGGGGGSEFDPADYYTYDPWLQWLRVSYCMLIVTVCVKVLNVAQFNDSIAFLVKILEKVISVILPFVVLWICIIIMFSFCINALDLVFFNSDSPTQGGDYEGFFNMFGPILLYTIRNSVGDFQPDTLKFLPMPQRITMWIYFMMIIVINVLVFMNFVIALINDCYNEVAESRVEEAF
jgi:hypothetical protein